MPGGGGRIELWPEGAPDAVGNEEADRPFLVAHVPGSKAPTAAVVVCPGGGYGGLATGHEGADIAKWLNGLGIAAFVLHYRLCPRYCHPIPLKDAQRAIRLVRHRAEDWNVDPNKLGVWGFSAGGHLASTTATHFDPGNKFAADPLERESSRPDFLILGYPVVTFKEPYAHTGSRKNLIGEAPDESLIADLSNETRVTRDTPPTFLFHTDADRGVPSENSVLFYLALRKAGVPAEMHIFADGPHGVGLAPDDPVLSKWPELLAGWLRSRGIV